jgi:hypothetical protein
MGKAKRAHQGLKLMTLRCDMQRLKIDQDIKLLSDVHKSIVQLARGQGIEHSKAKESLLQRLNKRLIK